MNKFLPAFFFSLFFVQLTNAQFLWYENETNTFKIEQESTSSGTFLRDIPNPDITGINTNNSVSKFNRAAGQEAFLQFDVYNAVTDFSGYSVTFKAYIDIPTAALTANNSKISVHFSNATVSTESAIERNFTVGQQWETFTFNFNGTSIPNAVINANGYQRIALGFANGTATVPTTTYYIDSISGSTDQVVDVASHQASWLSGSWGITFPVYGGERLDTEVAGGYDLPDGAQEVVDELPAVGHVITNLSYFAHSHYFALRQNSNVDVATEIHEALVPSVANQNILFEVMQKFKDDGKKIILYISTNYLDRAIDDGADIEAAWINYYTNNFAGDEYAAYKDLIEGFVLEVKEYADGYWLDTTAQLHNDGNLEDFVQMIRNADPGAIISAQPNGAYLQDENGNNILVDSDGLDDEDDTNYKIVSFEGVNTYQDFTSGHVTPLGQGAPPNSWAYEEFTIPAMVANPWSMYNGNTVLKHAWFPVRARWHVSSQPLIFGIEDGYRFTKRLVQANAGVTFATTIDDVNNKGFMMADEMLIMKTINDRLLSNPVPACVPYVRPEGAYLVGEEPLSVDSFNTSSEVKFYPNPVADRLTIKRTSTAINHITVINVLGTKVLHKLWDNGSTSTQVDVSSLPSGIYFIKLSNGSKHSITRKIIVSK
ncbi:T9SS type A sorting domain-containing protein [Lacinutrix sp. C3R15]|uniref:T9SS type A sorting domain-containing protein n=1 Tax=Flavobacteriaceae TaxID=49546 RepID=UPI001C097DB7|nr:MULTISPECIES: T9SS type A sorting domain-containing protein [Flavobacteriaceae]MBU2939807.1 T9SS type A sorting domain-containing protein [Lacinutrix sp. C3R15]MDO6623123.1 T9SS type A sorting domain-containing protein [Oceanihabitans sp. 1_MG-2023]